MQRDKVMICISHCIWQSLVNMARNTQYLDPFWALHMRWEPTSFEQHVVVAAVAAAVAVAVALAARVTVALAVAAAVVAAVEADFNDIEWWRFIHEPHKTHIHYSDVIMSAMTSQITGVSIVLHNCLFRHRSKKTSKVHVTGFSAGNSPVTGVFPARRASDAENVSIWWRHHGRVLCWDFAPHSPCPFFLYNEVQTQP